MKTYADSFGLQWNRFRRTQLDRFSGTTLSRDRFFAATGWPPSLEGERVLEAGSGAGRFTEVLLSTGAHVFTFDLSTAVYANLGNNGPHPRLHLLRADIYRIPFAPGTFGRVVCLGVLQHCPDVEAAFRSLAAQLRPGGELVFDVYDAEVRRPRTHPWYVWRRLLRFLPRPILFWLVRVLVPIFLPVKRWLARAALPYAGVLHHWIPILDYEGVFALDRRQILEWAILDTFDLLAPAYDQPQYIDDVARWLEREGLEVVHLKKGLNGIIARALKPAVAP
jgi:SAM-dependent methyltransferase